MCTQHDWQSKILPTVSCDRYGLVMPKGSSKSGSGQLGKVASVFNDDSSEEDEVLCCFTHICCNHSAKL